MKMLPEDPKMLDFLLEHPLLNKFSPEEVMIFCSFVKPIIYKAGETIFREKTQSHTFYFILKGKVEITKIDLERNETVPIVVLSDKELFGELAFIDREPRSGSARALEDTVVLSFDPDTIPNGAMPSSIFIKLSRAIASLSIRRLRDANDAHLKTLSAERNHFEQRSNYGKLFVYSVFLIGFSYFATEIFQFFPLGLNPHTMGFHAARLTLLFVPFLFIVHYFGEPWREFGVTLKHWKRSLARGCLISLGCTIIAIGICVLINYPLHDFFETIWNNLSVSFVLFCLFQAIVREFVARGIILTSLRKIFHDVRGLQSLVVTACFSSMVFIYQGLVPAASAFAASMFFGWIFLWDRNLINIILVHFILSLGVYPYLPH